MIRLLAVSFLIVVVLGCGQGAAPKATPVTVETLASEPAGAVDVIAARKTVKDGDAVVVVGRVGGDKEPILKDRAAFTLADRSLKPCNERDDDACPTPWDYCCDPPEVLRDSTVLVKLVDQKGATIGVDLRTGMNLRELQTVVVQGKAKRDAAGNFTLLADGVYIRK